MPNDVEPQPAKPVGTNQLGQEVHGPQTNIAGGVQGPVLPGQFNAPVHVGDVVTNVYNAPAIAVASDDEPPVPGDPPYKGLPAFEEADADRFFGREQLTAELIKLLGSQNLLIIVGASGSGKSSLVRAGLVPALKHGEPLLDGVHPPLDSPRWPVRIITPTTHPLKQLALSLILDSASVTEATPKLIDALAQDARTLDLGVSHLLQRTGGTKLLLIVDQFEELFTLCPVETERRAFVDNLLRATAEAGSATIAIIVLRADFYAHCARYENLREALTTQQKYIGSMTAEELRRAIEEPATQGDWGFEPELINAILKDVGVDVNHQPEPGILPLLSQALLETWKRRRGRRLTLRGYEESGGVSGAIARTADNLHTQLTPHEKNIARNIFVRLTALGEGTQDTRRRAFLSELNPNETPEVAQVLKKLVDGRMIVTNKEAGVDERETVEVVHEALIREWDTLRDWLREDRESLRLQRRLTEATLEWEALKRESSGLYRGNRLSTALEWAETHASALNPQEREFLAASQALALREAAEREAAQQHELEMVRKLASETESRLEAEQRELEISRRLVTESQNRLRAERQVTRRTRLLLGIVTTLFLAVVGVAFFSLLPRFRASAPLVQMHQAPAIIASVGYGAGEPEYLNPKVLYAIGNFAIEKYEVTNKRYLICVESGLCSPPTSTDYKDTKLAQYPVASVTALQAAEFCGWLGRRLPTEIEWERAARSTDGRLWPWGNTLPTSVHAALFGTLMPVGALPVGTSPEGVYDLAGNVWEWTSSIYENDGGIKQSVVRGGGYETGSFLIDIEGHIAYRFNVDSNTPDPEIGFRCAVSS